MAISTTYSKQQEELARKQGGIGSSTPYNGMKGVSQGTQNNLGNYQQGYQQSQAAQQYQQNLQSIQQNKPQTYSSKYGAQLDNLLNQITNPSQFKYEFNGDNLFKNYADLYTQKGKQASMDAMGQAAALTGGYGNTYAQQVGNQQYQQYLLNLYDRGMDLYDRAYQRNRDQIGDNLNAYNAVNAADQTQYGRYRDTVGDWQNERDYYTNAYNTERQADIDQYNNMLNYWTGMAKNENDAYNTEAALAENARQANLSDAYNYAKLNEDMRQADLSNTYNYAKLAEDTRQADLSDRYNYAKLTEEQRQADMGNQLDYAKLGENARQADLSDAYNYAKLAEDARQNNIANEYNYAKLGEDARQADQNNAYNYAALEEKQREADANLSEEQRQYNQKVAISYVTDILKNGQMPTNELLVAAGLSYEDAQKLMAVISAGGGSGNGGDEEGNGENIWRPAVEASASAGATTALQNDSAAYQAALAAMNLGTTTGTATSAATKKGSTTQKKTGTNAAANALAVQGYNTQADIIKNYLSGKKVTNDQSDANKKKGFSSAK
jgi:hypothetical protein